MGGGGAGDGDGDGGGDGGGALDGGDRGVGDGGGGGGGLDDEDTRGVGNGVEQSADVVGAPGNAGAPKDQVGLSLQNSNENQINEQANT